MNSANPTGCSSSSASRTSAYGRSPNRPAVSMSSVITTSCSSFSKRASPRISSAMTGTSLRVAGRMLTVMRGPRKIEDFVGFSFGSVAKAVDKPHGAMGVREARDLVVDQPRGQPCVDEVGIAKSAASTFQAYHPDRAVGLYPLLDLAESFQVGGIISAHEDKVDLRPWLAGDDVRGPLLDPPFETRVVEVDDRDLRARLHAQLVEEGPCRDGVRAHALGCHCHLESRRRR